MFALEQQGRAAVVTLSSPPVNALSNAWIEGLHNVLDRIEALEGVTVVHLRSALGVFCAGADLKEVEERLTQPPDAMVAYNRSLHRVFDRLEALPYVTLCEINGSAFGGGFELALACDLRIAAAESQIGLPEARLGLIPGAGGTQRLTRLCGPGVANRLILSGDVLDGDAACDLGLVQWAAPKADLAARTVEIRERVAALALPALQVSKRCIAAYLRPDVDGFEMEIEAQRELIVTDEAKTRVTAFVAERRARSGARARAEGPSA